MRLTEKQIEALKTAIAALEYFNINGSRTADIFELRKILAFQDEN
jgi:hypothetical protein